MVFLILESLGSTELAFILLMALVFLGPRKLPQLSRTIGKNLANFRRASEDFKRTWDKEVNLEELNLSRLDLEPSFSASDNSILNTQSGPDEDESALTARPTIEAVDPDRVVARQSSAVEKDPSLSQTDEVERGQPLLKREWL